MVEGIALLKHPRVNALAHPIDQHPKGDLALLSVLRLKLFISNFDWISAKHDEIVGAVVDREIEIAHAELEQAFVGVWGLERAAEVLREDLMSVHGDAPDELLLVLEVTIDRRRADPSASRDRSQ